MLLLPDAFEYCFSPIPNKNLSPNNGAIMLTASLLCPLAYKSYIKSFYYSVICMQIIFPYIR